MFCSITSFLLPAVIILQVAISVDATDVDNVVTHCKEKEKKFAAKEDKYAKKSKALPSEPQLFDRPFIKEQQIAINKLELTQRPFECISDALQENNDEKLQNSKEYQSLVQECKACQPTTPQCDQSYPYRIINGTCNNLKSVKWGSTHSCFTRLFQANYEGVSGLRKSVKSGKELPNTREIARVLVQNVIKVNFDFTTLFTYFGQVPAHDLAMFPFTMVRGRKRLDCCENDEKDQHPQCIPIPIDPTDVFYSAQGVDCFNVERVIPCDTCSVGKRIPINYVTSWLDLSIVYGQTDVRAQKLRRKDGTGKLKSQEKESGELLPADKTKGSTCGIALKGEYCFTSGDTRSNQHTPMMIFHTLFLREHNRIATKLKELNPDWDEEKLYQESRKIVIAEYQVILYKEYLPVLLGPKLMSEFGLNINDTCSYDPSVDPSISVEFNGAGFRVHTLIPGTVALTQVPDMLELLFQNAIPLYNDKISAYLDEMAKQPGDKHDHLMPDDLNIWMYRPLTGTFGFDLTAIDLQRGRDVGLPSYAQTIEYLENRPGTILTFLDLTKYIVPECLLIFGTIYEDVRDIDLYAGILCEIVPDDMVISKTAAHFIADQFQRSKIGDRFHLLYDESFTKEQRDTIIEFASLAKIICDNTDMKDIQPQVMKYRGDSNESQKCSEIPGIDLKEWKKNKKQ